MLTDPAKPITAEEAAHYARAAVSSTLRSYAAGILSVNPLVQRPAAQHGVSLAVQIGLAVMDALAPGHPVVSVFDVLGHGLMGSLQGVVPLSPSGGTPMGTAG